MWLEMTVKGLALEPKWIDRYLRLGPAGLEERSAAPARPESDR